MHRDRRGDERHHAVRAADRPSPSPAPPGQHTRASRTRQPARSQAFLDRGGVGLYREHRASERNHTALPQLPAKDDSGRAVAYPDPKIVTVAAPTNTVNTTRPPACRSARSTAPTRPYVVILSGGQQSGRTVPPTSRRWVNLRDRRDPVALAGLYVWWPAAEDDDTLDNGWGSPHSAERYLGKRQTGAAVLRALPDAGPAPTETT